MSRCIIRIIMLSVLLCLSMAEASAQDVKDVAIDDQTEFELRGTVAVDTIIVPLKFGTAVKKASSVTLPSDTPYLVRLGAQNSQRFSDAIRVSLNNQRPVLNLIVDMHVLSTPGTYTVTVNCMVANKKVPLKISLIRPAATIDTISTVYIRISGNQIKADPFVLDTRKSKADIHELPLADPYFTGVHEGVVVHFPGSVYEVKAGQGQPFTAVYKLDASGLSLGRTTGRLQIKSPEMVSAIEVPFDIWKKMDDLWIIVIVFAGLLVGAFVRHFLKDKKEWEELRLKGLELTQRIIQETKEITDASFRAEITDLLNQLIPLLERSGGLSRFTGRPARPLEEKINSTLTDYNTKRDAFLVRLKAQQDAWQALSASFDERLHPGLKALLGAASLSFKSAKQSLDKFDPTTAAKEIGNAAVAVQAVLVKIPVYYSSLTLLLKEGKVFPTAIPQGVKDEVNNYVSQMDTLIEQVKTNSSTAAGSTQAVTEADKLFYMKDNLFKYLLQAGETQFRYSTLLKAEPIGITFAAVFEEWKLTLQNLSENPRQLEKASAYLSDTLIARFNNAWAPVAEAMGGATLGDQAAAEAAAIPAVLSKVKTSFTAADYFDERGIGLTTILADTNRAQRNWFLYAALQVFFLSLLLGLVAYKVYADKFVGTWDDFIGIFLFAFSVDITVANVVKLAGDKSGA